MAGHPQNSPRGLWAKQQLDIVSSGGVATRISGDSSGLVLDRGLTLGSSSVAITVDSTGYLLGSRYISTNTTGNEAT